MVSCGVLFEVRTGFLRFQKFKVSIYTDRLLYDGPCQSQRLEKSEETYEWKGEVSNYLIHRQQEGGSGRLATNLMVIIIHSEMTTFCCVAPCSFIEVGRRFRGAYCLFHQGPDL
jgi:hypothetical protein